MLINFTDSEFAQLVSLITYFSSTPVYRIDADWTTIAYKVKTFKNTFTTEEIKALNKASHIFSERFAVNDSDYIKLRKKIQECHTISH